MHKVVAYRKTIDTPDGFSLAVDVSACLEGAEIFLLLHGLAVDNREYLNFYEDFALFLADQNVSCARPTFRGHGESSGSPRDITIAGSLIDAKMTFRCLASLLPSIDVSRNRIYVVGTSFGACAALGLAKAFHGDMAGIGLLTPALDLEKTLLRGRTEFARQFYNRNTELAMWETGQIAFPDDCILAIRFVEEMKWFKTVPIIMGLKLPLIVIHGTSDSIVPFELTATLTNNIQNVSVVAMNDMDHGFMDYNDPAGTSTKSQENRRVLFETFLEHARQP